MEEILKYENRDNLYKYLIDDFGFTKTKEEYFPKSFGNFFIILEDRDITLTYNNDRSFLTIDIANKSYQEDSFDLYFVKNFIYNSNNINTEEQEKNNDQRIEELNNFLKKDMTKIKYLFNSQNYPNTKKQINEQLKKEFYRNFK